jgi:hypothetical protein
MDLQSTLPKISIVMDRIFVIEIVHFVAQDDGGDVPQLSIVSFDKFEQARLLLRIDTLKDIDYSLNSTKGLPIFLDSSSFVPGISIRTNRVSFLTTLQIG